jgi:4-amino-4-deoxy-L-arabinose transferase-like glycosyltransferase
VTTRRFGIWLAVVAAVGLALRLVYLYAAPETLISGDGSYFHLGANLLAEGKGFIHPYAYVYSLGTVRIPGAEHPPGWTVVLTIPSLLGFKSHFEHEWFSTLVGVTTIVVMGFAGRRLAGPRVGLIAAALTALYPGFWLYERQLLSETLALLECALVILLALRFQAQPSWLRALLLGVVLGALALTRSEMLLFVGVLLVPLVLLTRGSWRQRVAWIAVGGGAAALVIAPWVGYNLERFDERVLISSQGGRTLAASNCDRTYYGPLLGYKDLFNPGCTRKPEIHVDENQPFVDTAKYDSKLRHLATKYVRSHVDRLPVVLAAREGRTFGAFRPFQQFRLDLIRGNIAFFWMQYFFYLAMLPAAVAGVVVLWRRRAPLWPMLALVAMVVITVAGTFGSTRYRVPADIGIAMLAAVGIDAALRALHGRRRTKTEAAEVAETRTLVSAD